MTSHYIYRVGGSLSWNDPTYIERQADIDLSHALQQGVFCYVFGPWQIGKSSLRIRTNHHLRQRGYRCVTVDATQICALPPSQHRWAVGLITSIWDGLYPSNQELLNQWLRSTVTLPVRQRLDRFIREVIFPELFEGPIIIMIDEVEYLFKLPFAISEFFDWIWSCYSLRETHPIYWQLNFALLGTANLLEMYPRTLLFASGCPITLNNFELIDLRTLSKGLTSHVKNPLDVLQAIFRWTQGQPLLTQKMCQIVLNLTTPLIKPDENHLSMTADATLLWIDQIVREHLIQNWQFQDEPAHLRAIENHLMVNPQSSKLLTLYQAVLEGQSITVNGSYTQMELLLSGIVIDKDNHLAVANPIYRQVFNRQWVKQKLQDKT